MKQIRSVVLSMVMGLLALGVLPSAFGQNFNSEVAAANYAQWVSQSQSAVAASSGQVMTLAPCYFVSPGGTGTFFPFATTVPITVTDGTLSETVTPTAISTPVPASGSQYPGGFSCTITATFNNAHAAGVRVTTGSGGVAEAINAVVPNRGLVLVGQGFQPDTAISALTNADARVVIDDISNGYPKWWTTQPTTLSALATPATRSASAGATQVISGTATGTWPASTEFVCVTYVDQLGGESPCSGSFSFTATASVALNYAAPAASTGAVGWRAYGGLAAATQYLLPISATTCTLSTRTPFPTCAIGSAAVFPDPVTTSSLAPGYTVNTYRQNTQSHTTFGYVPTTQLMSACATVQTNWGPFTASAGGTTGQIEVLGTVPLINGCLNYIGKTIRITGHITMTAGASETPVLKVQLGPTFSTGTPTNICQFANTTALSAAVYSLNFSCTMTVNATGASGTVMPEGIAVVALGAGTTAGTAMPELGTAAITNKLDAVNYLYVTYIPTSGTNTAAQLLDLHIEEM